jgi:hypothetical protein
MERDGTEKIASVLIPTRRGEALPPIRTAETWVRTAGFYVAVSHRIFACVEKMIRDSAASKLLCDSTWNTYIHPRGNKQAHRMKLSANPQSLRPGAAPDDSTWRCRIEFFSCAKRLLPLLNICHCWCACHKFDLICRKYVQYLYL